MRVMQKNWKFFVGIGFLLIIAGIMVFPDDDIIGVIGVLLGSYNIFKGIQLARGVQPYLIRKQKESLEETEKELREKLNDSKKE